jgi:hypothetical protein
MDMFFRERGREHERFPSRYGRILDAVMSQKLRGSGLASMKSCAARDATMVPMTNDVECRNTDWIDFIIASPRLLAFTEAARVQTEAVAPPAHDAFTRRLLRLDPTPSSCGARPVR